MARPTVVQLANGETQLWVPNGGDLDLDITWNGHVPTAAAASIFSKADEEVFLLTPFIQVAQGVIHLNVPWDEIAQVPDWGDGYWRLSATEAGSTKILLEGPAYLRPTGTHP